MVKICPIAEWSANRMPFEYRTKFSLIFRPPLDYRTSILMVVWIPNYHLNTGHLNSRTSKSLLFRCIRYSDPHCTHELIWLKHLCNTKRIEPKIEKFFSKFKNWKVFLFQQIVVRYDTRFRICRCVNFCYFNFLKDYSNHLNTEHLNTRVIWIPVRISNGST